MYKRIFGERLKALRREKGMNVGELAKILGTSEADVYYYENGYRDPNLKMIVRLVEIFGVTAGYLIGAEGVLTERQKLIREFMNMK